MHSANALTAHAWTSLRSSSRLDLSQQLDRGSNLAASARGDAHQQFPEVRLRNEMVAAIAGNMLAPDDAVRLKLLEAVETFERASFSVSLISSALIGLSDR